MKKSPLSANMVPLSRLAIASAICLAAFQSQAGAQQPGLPEGRQAKPAVPGRAAHAEHGHADMKTAQAELEIVTEKSISPEDVRELPIPPSRVSVARKCQPLCTGCPG
jgi:hypothetical protein